MRELLPNHRFLIFSFAHSFAVDAHLEEPHDLAVVNKLDKWIKNISK